MGDEVHGGGQHGAGQLQAGQAVHVAPVCPQLLLQWGGIAAQQAVDPFLSQVGCTMVPRDLD